MYASFEFGETATSAVESARALSGVASRPPFWRREKFCIAEYKVQRTGPVRTISDTRQRAEGELLNIRGGHVRLLFQEVTVKEDEREDGQSTLTSEMGSIC